MNILVYLFCILPFISSSPETQDVGFTQDWFSSKIPLWQEQLAHFDKKKNLHFLEIGSFEGRSALWLLENILKHPSSRLTCIDPWKTIEKVYTRFKNNIKKHEKKVKVIRDTASNALRKYETVPIFDFIYVDGGHEGYTTMESMVLSFPLLKPGGLVIIDDYKWMPELPEDERPQLAVDTFVRLFTKEIKVLHKGYQFIFKKKNDPIIKTEKKKEL